MLPAATARNWPSGASVLSLVAQSPAGDGPVGTQTARVATAGRHRPELTLRRIGLSLVAPSPAGDGPVGAQTARVATARRHCPELARWRIGLPGMVHSPAGDGPVGTQTTRVQGTGRDREELPRRHIQVAGVVPAGVVGFVEEQELVGSPACDGSVGPNPARVPFARRHDLVLRGWRRFRLGESCRHRRCRGRRCLRLGLCRLGSGRRGRRSGFPGRGCGRLGFGVRAGGRRFVTATSSGQQRRRSQCCRYPSNLGHIHSVPLPTRTEPARETLRRATVERTRNGPANRRAFAMQQHLSQGVTSAA